MTTLAALAVFLHPGRMAKDSSKTPYGYSKQTKERPPTRRPPEADKMLMRSRRDATAIGFLRQRVAPTSAALPSFLVAAGAFAPDVNSAKTLKATPQSGHASLLLFPSGDPRCSNVPRAPRSTLDLHSALP